MITLYQFTKRSPDFSSFCFKVEAFCKVAGIPYELKAADVRSAPKGKLPIAKINGELIPDSEHICQRLSQKYQIDLNAKLSAKEKAYAFALQKMVEEYLYWAMVYFRWQDDRCWPQTKKLFFGRMPIYQRLFVPFLARRGVIQSLRGHGIGRHKREEVKAFGLQCLDCLRDALGEQKYLMGDSISYVDICTAPLLYLLITMELKSPLTEALESYSTLVEYAHRFNSEVFS